MCVVSLIPSIMYSMCSTSVYTMAIEFTSHCFTTTCTDRVFEHTVKLKYEQYQMINIQLQFVRPAGLTTYSLPHFHKSLLLM